MEHYSVMKEASIAALNIKENGIYVDCTLGRAGHSSEILKRIPQGFLYCFDLDEEAIEKSQKYLNTIGKNYKIFHSNYANIKIKLAEENVEFVDGILMDLGVSSPMFDDEQRGFSYRYDSKLDMRMDTRQALSAYEVVNTYSYQELVKLFYEYGEEKFAKQIARNIEKVRADKPIETTFELVDIIKKSLPMKVLNKKGHPAKKVFQAIRIEVNNELHNLEIAIKDALDLLNVGGYLCVITFHSLEDRIVKQLFKQVSAVPKIDKRLPIIENHKMKYELINRKAIVADENELNENHRSHSAKMRIIKRVEW